MDHEFVGGRIVGDGQLVCAQAVTDRFGCTSTLPPAVIMAVETQLVEAQQSGMNELEYEPTVQAETTASYSRLVLCTLFRDVEIESAVAQGAIQAHPNGQDHF
jgi:hypothetical protein